MKGLEKCCILNGMDGTDSDMFWDGSEEEGNARG